MLQGVGMEVDTLTPEQKQLLHRIRVRKVQLRAAHQRRKAVANNQALLPHAADPERKLTTSHMRVLAHCSLHPVLPFAVAFPWLVSSPFQGGR